MADIPEFDEDDLDWDAEGASRVGIKVIEMCGRVKVADKIVPGAVAQWAIEIDGVRYEIRARVAQDGGS